MEVVVGRFLVHAECVTAESGLKGIEVACGSEGESHSGHRVETVEIGHRAPDPGEIWLVFVADLKSVAHPVDKLLDSGQ